MASLADTKEQAQHRLVQDCKNNQEGAVHMQTSFTLDLLEKGQSAVICTVIGSEPVHERLRDLGLTEKSGITCLFSSFGGDHKAYRIKGAIIGIRNRDARNVQCIQAGEKI